MRFWDSSALLPLVVVERRSAELESLLADDPRLLVWWATPVECGSAVHRLRREGAFTAREAAEVLSALAGIFDAADVVLPGDEVAAHALRLLAVHPLRAADALQLAAGLVWAQSGKRLGKGAQPSTSPRSDTDFVTLDDRLRTAATLEGFNVVPQ